jgi:SAM-dependent methyltransferase
MKCKICNSESKKTYENLEGYIQGKFYDLYECQECKVSFCDPMKSDDFVYESIYKQAEKVPGYNRYYHFARQVLKEKDPLNYLANSENMYWAIKKSLENNFQDKKNIKVLEIGSGLGYTTYALNKSGYSCVGIDISKEAVERAKEKFGDYYVAADIFEASKNIKEKYDAVIMTELIEHVESPVDFIKEAFKFLKDGGKLIITTPNKSFYPSGTIWKSDIPPVHLYWMGEETFLNIGKTLNKKVSFLDFQEFNKYFIYPKRHIEYVNVINLTNFKKDGKVFLVKRLKIMLKNILPVFFIKFINDKNGVKIDSPRSNTLCIVLS